MLLEVSVSSYREAQGATLREEMSALQVPLRSRRRHKGGLLKPRQRFHQLGEIGDRGGDSVEQING